MKKLCILILLCFVAGITNGQTYCTLSGTSSMDMDSVHLSGYAGTISDTMHGRLSGAVSKFILIRQTMF